jgi:hypothetical protein
LELQSGWLRAGLPAPAVREPLPQQPARLPRHSSVTGGNAVLPPSLVLAVFGGVDAFQRSPGPVRVGHSIDFRGAPPAGCEGWQARSNWSIPGVPPALDRSPCGRVLRAQAQSIFESKPCAGGIRGRLLNPLSAVTGQCHHGPSELFNRSRIPPATTGFPETSAGGAVTPASPSSPRLCGGLSYLFDVITPS